MGGVVLETESEKLIRQGLNQGLSQGLSQGLKQGISQGKAQMLIEIYQDEGLDNDTILKKLQDKIGLTLELATAYLKQYGKQPV